MVTKFFGGGLWKYVDWNSAWMKELRPKDVTDSAQELNAAFTVARTIVESARAGSAGGGTGQVPNLQELFALVKSTFPSLDREGALRSIKQAFEFLCLSNSQAAELARISTTDRLR